MAQTNGEFIEEFLDLSRMAITEAAPEVKPEDREHLASRILSGFLDLWGGCSIYIPQSAHLARLRRNQEIVAQFDGTMLTATRLANRHGISTVHLHRIVAAAKKRKP
jgi:Mor family transcriptional regulator